jgi:hypothetical protein
MNYDATEVLDKTQLFFIRKKESAIDELNAVCGERGIVILRIDNPPERFSENMSNATIK